MGLHVNFLVRLMPREATTRQEHGSLDLVVLGFPGDLNARAMCLLFVIYKAKETCSPDWDKLITYQGLAPHEAACTSLSEVLLQIVSHQPAAPDPSRTPHGSLGAAYSGITFSRNLAPCLAQYRINPAEL